MFCHKCGNKVSEDAKFCINCGIKVITSETPSQSEISQTTELKELMSMPKLLSLANFCRTLSVLRFVDASVWIVITLLQMGYGVGLGRIIWNIISVVIKFLLAIGLFPGKYIEALRLHGEYDINELSSIISGNIGWSVIGIIWYGVQMITNGAYISLVILLEIAIIIIGIAAIIKAKSISPPGKSNY